MGLKFLSEDDNDYVLEKATQKSLLTRLRLVFLFFVFLLIIFVLIKNNYSLSFDRKDLLEFTCGPNNTLDSSDDDFETRGEKIARAIQVNQQKISLLPGFEKVYSAQEPRGYQGRNIFVTKIIFSQENPEQKKIPEQLCGFDIDLVYK